jgi:hypothetical protein
MPHNVAQWRDGLTGGVGGTVLGRDSETRRGVDLSLTWAPANVSALNPPCWGSRYGGGGPVRSSSETEPRSRGCSALDRDMTPLEGASCPRARRNLDRGGRPASERGGTSPEGATGPRARRSFTSAAPCPSSEAEFRPRVARPTVWWAVGPWVYLTRVFRFVCVCFLRR